MVRFLPAPYTQSEWDAIVAPLKGLALPQIWSWGEVKGETASWRVERGLLKEGENLVGAAQVMVRRVPFIGSGVAWVSRGPLYGSASEAMYPDLLTALRKHYVNDRKLHLRVVPALPAEACDLAGLARAGFRHSGAPGWVSALVNLSLQEEELRRGLDQKWRNALNKAERQKLVVKDASDGPDFSVILRQYEQFLGERGFVSSVTPQLLARLQQRLPDDHKMTASHCTLGTESLGTIVIARYGDRAEYLVGALSTEGRRYNVGQLLLWRALLAAKAAGARWFDLGGMDPLVTPKGIFNFKSGVGGTIYRLADELEADDSGLRARLVRWRIARARGTA